MLRRGLVGTVGILCCLAVLPATATAGNWTYSTYGGRSLAYTGDPGEANNVTAHFDGSSVTVTDSAGVHAYCRDFCSPPPPNDCELLSATSFRCPYAGDMGSFWLDDGDDSFTYSEGAPVVPAPSDPLQVYGGAGNDNITGSPYRDELDGDAGNYGLRGPGNDRISGGDGDDAINFINGQSLDTAENTNVIDAGAGDDRIQTFLGTNTVSAGPGKDFFSGGDGRDVVEGGEGRDFLYGSLGQDLLSGGDDKDDLEGGPDIDVVKGDAGDDFLQASSQGGCGGPDTFVGGRGHDSLYVYCGRPTVLFRDGDRDTGNCKPKARPVRLALDRIDRLKGTC